MDEEKILILVVVTLGGLFYFGVLYALALAGAPQQLWLMRDILGLIK